VDFRGRTAFEVTVDRDKNGKVTKFSDPKSRGLSEGARHIKADIDVDAATKKASAMLGFQVGKEVRANRVKSEYRQAANAFSSASEALQMLEKNPTVYRNWVERGLIRGEGGEFETKIKEAVLLSVFSQSGKTVTEGERKAFDKIWNPKWLNDPELAKKKIISMIDLSSDTIDLFENPQRSPEIAEKVVKWKRGEEGLKEFQAFKESVPKIGAGVGTQVAPSVTDLKSKYGVDF